MFYVHTHHTHNTPVIKSHLSSTTVTTCMLCMHQSARREDEYSTENFTPINANSFVSRHQVLYHQSAMFLIYCNFIVKLQYLLLPGQNLSNETSELQERQISLLHTCIII